MKQTERKKENQEEHREFQLSLEENIKNREISEEQNTQQRNKRQNTAQYNKLNFEEYNTAQNPIQNQKGYSSLKQIEYTTQPYKTDFIQLMWPIKVERKSKAEMGGALGLYYPAFDHAVIDDLLYGDKYAEVWVHENIHRHNGASEQNVRERTKYRVGE